MLIVRLSLIFVVLRFILLKLAQHGVRQDVVYFERRLILGVLVILRDRDL